MYKVSLIIQNIVVPDVCKVDEGVDGQGDPEGASLPRAGRDLLARNLKQV